MNVDIGTLATLHAQELHRQAAMARLAGEIAPGQHDYRKLLARILRAVAHWIEPATHRIEPGARRMEPSVGLVASTRQGLN